MSADTKGPEDLRYAMAISKSGQVVGSNQPLLELSLLAGWFGYLLVAPTWGFGWVEAWHNEQRAVQTILLGLVGIVTAAVPRLRTALVPRTGIGYAAWVLVAIGLTSALDAAFVVPALVEVSLHVLLVVLVVVTASAVARDPVRLALWARRACLALAVAHVTGITARYVGMLALGRPLALDVLLLGYANPRFPSALYALLMPFCATLVADPREIPALRWIGLVMLALLWAVNVALGTRAIWLAYGFVLPLLPFVVGWPRSKSILLALAGSALAGVLLYYLLFVGVPTWMGTGTTLRSRMEQLTSLSDRELLWAQAWQIMTNKPFLGVGPMNFAALGDSFAAHPHDWIMQIGSEWGVPALAILLWIIWRLGQAVYGSVHVDRGNDVDILAPLAATLVGLVYGLVDGNLVMPVSQTAYALTLGILLGLRTTPATTGVASRPVLAAGTAAFVLASTLCLLAYTASTLPQQPESERMWRVTSRFPDLAPRFWQQGLLR